ncbi:MAG TPA: LLM class flavin-dependent oxidoreductase [Candidatus Eisenbacteria bacterium]|nr:LLM class flavin-dependent oxidoreductase [Candidatus Eisenbacteria bacterium]
MKIRIGMMLADSSVLEADPEAVLAFIDRCERWDVDSVWVSDRIVGPRPTLDPIVFMAYVASRRRNMKFGASALVLPTRQPVVLAKQLATLDFLCRGRLLLVVGLGSDDSRDFDALGVRREERGRRADEAIVLMKKLWSEDRVSFNGRFYSTRDLTLLPKPHQKGGPPLWAGGRSRAAFRRAGRLLDGWLGSSVTPAEAASAIDAIRRHASEAGREVPEDHYGVLVPFCFARSEEEALASMGSSIRRRRRDLPPQAFSALGTPEQVREKLQNYIDAGATKFVMRPAGPEQSFAAQVELLAKEVVPTLQTPFSDRERAERAGSVN